MTPSTPKKPETSAQVRAHLMDALRLDLVGPRPGEDPHKEERLPSAPSKWYLTGFLVPYEAPPEQRSDDTGDDELDQVENRSAGDDEQVPEAASARKAFFPSSMGLSVLVDGATDRLKVSVSWGDYKPLTQDGQEVTDLHGGPVHWQRMPREAELEAPLTVGREPTRHNIPDSGGLQLVVSVRDAGDGRLVPAGTRSVSVFLVNYRPMAPDLQLDTAHVFQAQLTLCSDLAFVPRPDPRGGASDDWDDQVADLQYRDVSEYGVGHNISALATRDEDGCCRTVRTAWMPTAQVEKVVSGQVKDAELGMEALAATKSAEDVRRFIGPMIEQYGHWIEEQTARVPDDPTRRQVALDLMKQAQIARQRIQGGLDLLDDPLALEAFRMANRAIARAIRQRSTHGNESRPEDLKPPVWRPFQLAFLVMNMAGVANGQHPDREVVDLLFFPTGGGKTEAYLGLAAFIIVHRRLRDPSIQSAGLSVLMRYTLRLLTLDQLGRAATLVCALELERQQDVEQLGRWPLEIGLWVGQTATPNTMGKKGDHKQYTARARTIAYQNDDRRKPSPIPLEECPWCGAKFNRNSFLLLPDPDAPMDLRVSCGESKCDFFTRRQQRGLPILAVDEPIYRRLPAFIIATVDKFANLPWVGDTAGLFGRVNRHDADGFYGPGRPGRGRPLEGPLLPPDLIIQDELHLISGPLGTMVGLYETVIDALCCSTPGSGVRPKVVASTATVRRASSQIQALFGRSEVDIFPPPGPDRRDSFFARTVGPEQKNARLYLGIAAQGRNLKVVLMRTYLALLAAGQHQWKAAGAGRDKENPADPYMTLIGYFNSLRELGGSRRIVEDEVQTQLVDYGRRRLRVGERDGMFADRKKLHELRELTSRVSTNEVADTKRRLAATFHHKERVDVALATNMISVGLDITRLGLMVVLGQPKTAAEYIQATSRVGRDDERPGLVVTLLNVHRPRDRSHYEGFSAWHESFYRSVEATSVTPFSPRAIDRGLAGVVVALARLGHAGMTAPRGAAEIARHREELDYVVEAISRRAECHTKELGAAEAEALRQKVRGRVIDLLDVWTHIADARGDLQYQREEGKAPPLLFNPLDTDLANQPREARRFIAHRSLRDVEPSVNLWVQKPDSLDFGKVGS